MTNDTERLLLAFLAGMGLTAWITVGMLEAMETLPNPIPLSAYATAAR